MGSLETSDLASPLTCEEAELHDCTKVSVGSIPYVTQLMIFVDAISGGQFSREGETFEGRVAHKPATYGEAEEGAYGGERVVLLRRSIGEAVYDTGQVVRRDVYEVGVPEALEMAVQEPLVVLDGAGPVLAGGGLQE